MSEATSKIESTPTTMPDPRSAPDRESLRADLERTRLRFHALLDSVSEEQWLQKSPSSAWSVREVFVHLTWALEYLPQEIASARQGKGMFNSPKWIGDPLSYVMFKWLGRGASRESIKRRYDVATVAALASLDEVPDSDWSLGANFYGEGFHSVADLFRAPARHLTEHTQGL